MVSPVLPKMVPGVSHLERCRLALIEGGEKVVVVASDQKVEMGGQCSVLTGEDPGLFLKVSSGLAISRSEIHAPPSSRGASRNVRSTALESWFYDAGKWAGTSVERSGVGWRVTRSRDAVILFIMEHADEIQRLCIETRALRLRISMAAGRRMLVLRQLRKSLAERERLLMWSRELGVRARATDHHQKTHI